LNIDADYIINCSGKPKSYDLFYKSTFIPVNAAYITQCPWEYPRFQYTLTIARPYGWVFGIPLKNRCSIGYLFNKTINNLSQIQEDVKEIFNNYELLPSEKTNYLEFENYYRKQNYTERMCYNGNSSFFLEPLEATSVGVMDHIQKNSFLYVKNLVSLEEVNSKYLKLMKEIENVIMLHYFSGSKYNSEFWDFAKENGKKCMNDSIKNDEKFSEIILKSITGKFKSDFYYSEEEYGGWSTGSFMENLIGLGISNELLLEIIQQTIIKS
jgi:tryptophan halogenase